MGSQHLEYRVDPIYFLIVPLISGASIPHLATKTVNMFGLQTSFVLSLNIRNVIGIKELLPTRKLLTFFLHQTLRIGCRAALIILLLICRAVYIFVEQPGSSKLFMAPYYTFIQDTCQRLGLCFYNSFLSETQSKLKILSSIQWSKCGYTYEVYIH